MLLSREKKKELFLLALLKICVVRGFTICQQGFLLCQSIIGGVGMIYNIALNSIQKEYPNLHA